MHQGPSARDSASGLIPLRGRALPDLVVAPVEMNDLNSPHTLAVLSVSPGASVLDIGCGPGVVAKALDLRGCKVWGLEIDPRRAAIARQHCVDVVEDDVESINLSEAFGGRVFDTVLCLDVLEHLRDPATTLANAAELLAPGGVIMISIPNITHGALRLELLGGRFRYRDSGLLDRGHLRFFDVEGLDQLLRQAGCRAESMLRVMRRLDETEFNIDLTTVPEAIRTTLENDVDALTYQFFVIAKPTRAPHYLAPAVSLLERQHARIAELSAELDKGSAYTRHVEAEFAKKDGRLQELEAALETRNARVRELESAAEFTGREADTRTARLAELGQVIEDLKRLSEDSTAYVSHLEGELRKRAGDIAVRDDEMCVLRAHIEKTEQAIAVRDDEMCMLRTHIEKTERAIAVRDDEMCMLRTHIEKTERAIADRDARLQIAHDTIAEGGARLAESHDGASHLSWVLHQPRHRLAESLGNVLTNRLPRLHRLLRPIVLATLRASDNNTERRGSGAD